jgi:hypothetical protein
VIRVCQERDRSIDLALHSPSWADKRQLTSTRYGGSAESRLSNRCGNWPMLLGAE